MTTKAVPSYRTPKAPPIFQHLAETTIKAQFNNRVEVYDYRFFGSATMRKKKKSKGNEPDACFYVQTAAVLGNRIKIDFTVDPPPDVVVEVDIHHDSTDNDPIYAALGVPEIWRYDGLEAAIYHLRENDYAEAEASIALPMITSAILTEYLTRLRREGEFEAVIAFDEWLQSLPQ